MSKTTLALCAIFGLAFYAAIWAVAFGHAVAGALCGLVIGGITGAALRDAVG